jgi:hypothetical protein
MPTGRPPLVDEVSAKFFTDRGCHVEGVTDSYGRILGSLDWNLTHYFSENLVSPGIEPGPLDP